MTAATPGHLAEAGAALWRSVIDQHELSPAQLAVLEQACRAKDQCDRMNRLLAEEHDSALQRQVNQTAKLLKQLLAALRLPDASGRRPQYRGPRGAYRRQR